MLTVDATPPSRRPRLSRRGVLQAAAGTVAAATVGGGMLAAPVAAQTGTPVAGALDAFPVETQLALHAIVDQALAATETPGAIVGVWYPGQGSWVRTAGIGDLATGAGTSVDDHWRIASNTKTFVATVVLQLVDEGLVGLDDPISDYVAEVPNGDTITVRQVLGMTSGVADWVTVPEFGAAYEFDPLMAYLPEQALAWIRDSEPVFEPGAQVMYSNSNYILLGFLIETVTGMSAGRAITERVIEPLGLTQTSFPTTPTMPAPYLHGYDAPPLGTPLRDVSRSNPWVPWTAGAMISTLADMKTWVEALGAGALVSPEMHAARLDGREVSPGGARYGLGVFTIKGLVGHSGGIAGYSSWMLNDPVTGFTFIAVATRSGEQGGTVDALLFPILDLLLPGLLPTIPPPTDAAPATPTA